MTVHFHVTETFDIPLSSADFTIDTPGIRTLSYTVSYPLGKLQHLRTRVETSTDFATQVPDTHYPTGRLYIYIYIYTFTVILEKDLCESKCIEFELY